MTAAAKTHCQEGHQDGLALSHQHGGGVRPGERRHSHEAQTWLHGPSVSELPGDPSLSAIPRPALYRCQSGRCRALPGTPGCSGDCCAAGEPRKQVVPGTWPENLAQSPSSPTAASSLANEGWGGRGVGRTGRCQRAHLAAWRSARTRRQLGLNELQNPVTSWWPGARGFPKCDPTT